MRANVVQKRVPLQCSLFTALVLVFYCAGWIPLVLGAVENLQGAYRARCGTGVPEIYMMLLSIPMQLWFVYRFTEWIYRWFLRRSQH